jgi:hypothetical protein
MPALTEPEICEARLRYANGERMKALADYYGVTIVTMHCAIRGVRHRKYKTGNRVAPIPLGRTNEARRKLKPHEVVEARRRHGAGEKIAPLAREFKVTNTAMRWAIQRRTFKWVS